MRICFYPFFSQQDKVSRKFRLDSDSGVKLQLYMMEQAIRHGWHADIVTPPEKQCIGSIHGHTLTSPPLCMDNLDRRIQWDPAWLRYVGELSDVVITTHEFLAIPLRALCPKLCIIMECGIRPDTAWPETAALFPLAWKASDLVHCNSNQLAMTIYGAEQTAVWQFAYDADVAKPSNVAKYIDVVFPARASSTNYSNHVPFIESMRNSPYSILMTDPTRYLRTIPNVPAAFLAPQMDRYEYIKALQASKVVVGLTDNGYGGYAFQEAIACGACPVALDIPEYRELLGTHWPYYTTLSTLRKTIDSAIANGWSLVPPDRRDRIMARLRERSYQHAWTVARADIEAAYLRSRERHSPAS